MIKNIGIGLFLIITIWVWAIDIPRTRQALENYEAERKMVIYSQKEMRDYMLLILEQNNNKLKPSAFKAKVKAK